MKKFVFFLLKYVISAVAFLVVTVVLNNSIGFIKAFETAFIYLFGLVVAELLLVFVKWGYKLYKKSRAKKAEMALKAAKKAEDEKKEDIENTDK